MNENVRAASPPLSRITATASHRHGLLTLSLFLSDRLLASPLSHALLFPTVWLNRSQYTFDSTNSLSDCNKARIASTWSANPRWSSSRCSGNVLCYSSWSNDTAAVCPDPPRLGPLFLVVGGTATVAALLGGLFVAYCRGGLPGCRGRRRDRSSPSIELTPQGMEDTNDIRLATA